MPSKYKTTYDPLLSTEKDWVRFLIGDRNVDEALFSDEEILVVLTIEPNRYLAAARMAETLLAQHLGVVSKAVEDLHLSFDHSPTSAYRKQIDSLRERGARELLKKSGAHSLRNL